MTSMCKKMVGFMGWAVPEQGWRKGPWTSEEDKLLVEYVSSHGEGRWSSVSRCSGLNRSGKSCRLRWVNYLRPGLKRGQITPQEEGIIIELHALWGNKWSTIARYLPGRTDNEIKNYWRTHFKKRKERSARKSSEKRRSQNPKANPPSPQSPPQPQAQEAPNPQTEGTNILTVEVPVSTVLTVPNTTMEEQNLVAPTMSWMDAICLDLDGSWWGSLWNFGDQASTGRVVDQMMTQDQYCSKMALLSVQNQGTNMTTINNNNINANNGISWGVDPNYLYNNNGGCIF